MRRITLSVTALLALVVCTTAQSFNFPSFTGTTPATLNGNAFAGGGGVRLAAAMASTKGSLFHNSQFEVVNGFDTTFSFKINVPLGNSGADGMAFVIHNDPRGTTFLGNHAAALGYSAFATSPAGTGVLNALVVEIDTFAGSFGGYADGSSNQLSIHTNGVNEVSHSEGQSLGRVTPTTNMSNNTVHTLRVLYLPGTLSLFLNGAATPTLSVPYSFAGGGTHDLPNTPVGGLSLNNGMAWLGFTASCGGSFEDHDLLSWSFTSLAPPAWPGNSSDFDCEVKVNGTVDATSDRVIGASALDVIGLRFHSPAGGTDSQLFSAFYQLVVTGAALNSLVVPGETPPGGFWLDTTGMNPGALTGVVPYLDGLGLGGGGFLTPLVIPGGFNYGFVVPPSIGGLGLSLMLQALVVDPGLNSLNLGIDDAIELQIN